MFQHFIERFSELIQVYPVFIYLIVGFLGATIGSFLNVVIYRTPIMIEFEYAEIIKANSDNVHSNVDEAYNKGNGLTLSKPRSRCSCCGKMIPWYHNIPILSYFILRGKCFSCDSVFSPRYAIIEIINTVAWLLLYYFFGFTVTFLMLAVLFSLLITMSIIDFDHKILPDNLVFTTGGLAFLFSTTSYSLLTPTEAIYQSILTFTIAHVFISLYSKLRGQLMMGFGDIKLIGALTPLIGLNNFVYAILIACILGIIYYVAIMLSKRLDEDKTFAFGPFICLGYYSVFVYHLT